MKSFPDKLFYLTARAKQQKVPQKQSTKMLSIPKFSLLRFIYEKRPIYNLPGPPCVAFHLKCFVKFLQSVFYG